VGPRAKNSSFQVRDRYGSVAMLKRLTREKVPGLPDNRELGIRKNKLTVAGSDIRAIFKPILDEVLKLVTGQIRASRKPMKAIILVGGFGQNAYLRDSIRQEVKRLKVEVMQSPNRLVTVEKAQQQVLNYQYSWTAVVRGALMKGLASTSPAFAKVKISERSARKHYGVCVGIEYSRYKHDDDYKVWDPFSGFYRVYMMDWFITKVQILPKVDFCAQTNFSIVSGQDRQRGQTSTPALQFEEIDVQRPFHRHQRSYLLI